MIPLRDHNPSERTPFVGRALIVLNMLIFLAYLPLFGDERQLMAFFLTWGVVPAEVARGEGLIGLVSSQFLHGGWLHLGFNMLFLWIFGDNMEEEWGHLPFLGFYLACGVAAALVQVAAEPASPIPMVGASGAIAGVLGGYLLLFPRRRLHSSKPRHGASERHEALERTDGLLAAQGDSPEAFDLIEEPFDQIALPVEHPVDGFGAAAGRVLLDLRGRPQLVGDEVAEMVGVIARIGDYMTDVNQPCDQRAGLRAVAPVPGCDQEPDRQTQRIDGGVDLGGQPAPGSSDGVSFRPPF